jgi:hypothetical protein
VLGPAANAEGVRPHFSPRDWKGGAPVPPLQGLPDYLFLPGHRIPKGLRLPKLVMERKPMANTEKCPIRAAERLKPPSDIR